MNRQTAMNKQPVQEEDVVFEHPGSSHMILAVDDQGALWQVSATPHFLAWHGFVSTISWPRLRDSGRREPTLRSHTQN